MAREPANDLDPRQMARQLYGLNRMLVRALVQCELACERELERAEKQARRLAEVDQTVKTRGAVAQ